MKLLQKKLADGTYYDFKDILAGEYEIEQNPREIDKIQYANNKRKKFVTPEEDIVIELTLSPRDEATTREYIKHLTSGVYKFYSIKHNAIQEKNFIVEVDPFTLETYASNKMILDDIEVTLELGEEE